MNNLLFRPLVINHVPLKERLMIDRNLRHIRSELPRQETKVQRANCIFLHSSSVNQRKTSEACLSRSTSKQPQATFQARRKVGEI